MRILKPGGRFLADNVFAGGQVHLQTSTSNTARSIHAFLAAIERTPLLKTVIVPLADDCLMGMKQ